MAQSTSKDGFYGADTAENVFPLPGTTEKYFTLVNEKTGEVEIWENDSSGFSVHDKRVGNINPDTGQVEFNKNWWGGANNKDQKIINANLGKIKEQALKTTQAGIIEDNPDMDSDAAAIEARKLAAKNKALAMQSVAGDVLENPSSLEKPDIGPSTAGTREEANSFGVHVFPTSLRTGNDGQDFMKIDMMAFKARDIVKGRKKGTLGLSDRSANRQTLGSVILPIPGGIQDQQQVSWASDKINPFQLAVSQIALTAIQRGLGAGVDAAGKAVENALKTKDTRTALGTYFAGQAAGQQNLLQRTTGAIMNPNMELLFNAPDLRNFTFNFQLAPRNEAEAMTVVRIIRFFKQGMSPIRSKSRLFLKSPHTFRLAYKNTATASRNGTQGTDGFGVNDHPYLNKFKECALGGFMVNYTPNGQYSTYEDGVMTAYQITMNFQEMTPIYNDDYGNKGNIVPSRIGF